VILGFASNFWHFLLANILNSFLIIDTIAWQCYLVEDVEPEHRIYVFNSLEVIGILSGFFAPITGLLLSKYPFIETIRGLYLFAGFCMLVSEIIRYLTLTETSVGKKILDASTPQARDIFKDLLKTLGYIGKNRPLILIILLNILVSFSLTINGLFYTPFLTEYLHFSEGEVSVIPMVTSLVALGVMLFLIPRIRKSSSFLITGLGLYIAGAVLLLAASSIQMIAAVLANVICWAGARSLINIILQSEISNAIHDDIRANVMAVYNILSMVCMFPAGIIGGQLYELSPAYPFYFTLLTFVLSMALYLLSIGIRKKTSVKTAVL